MCFVRSTQILIFKEIGAAEPHLLARFAVVKMDFQKCWDKIFDKKKNVFLMIFLYVIAADEISLIPKFY